MQAEYYSKICLLITVKVYIPLERCPNPFSFKSKVPSPAVLKMLPRFGEREFVVIRCSFPEREIRLRCYHGRRAKERS